LGNFHFIRLDDDNLLLKRNNLLKTRLMSNYKLKSKQIKKEYILLHILITHKDNKHKRV